MLLERFYFYNFSLGLGFSGRSGSGSSLLPDLGMPPMTSLPPSAPIASLMLMLLGIPPKLSGMPQSISIKEAMDTLDGKLVIGGVPKLGNKDDPDPDQPEKPKPKLKL